MNHRRRVACLIACVVVVAAACESDTTNPPQGVTGAWSTPDAGVAYLFEMELTESDAGQISGDWSGFTTGCTPLNDPECPRNGTVSGSRTGTEVTLTIVPAQEREELSATATLSLVNENLMSGILVRHECGAPDDAPIDFGVGRGN